MNASTYNLVSGILVVLHLVGVSSLLGGFLTQMKSLKTGGAIVPAIMHGAWLLLITGFALVGLVGMAPSAGVDDHINNAVLGIKCVVIAVIFFLAIGFGKKDLSKAKWVVPVIGALTLLNVCLAVLGPIVN